MRSAKASIVKLGHNHYRVFVEAARDPITGKRRRLSKTVRGSAKKAEEAKIELLILAGDVEHVSAVVSIENYIDSVFLPGKLSRHKKGKLKLRTYETYCDRIDLYIRPYLGNRMLASTDAPDIERWLEVFDTEAKKKEALRMLSMIYSHAIAKRYLRYNPCVAVERPEADEYEPGVLDEEDIEVYMWHFRGSRVEPLVLLAIGGAFRRGEMIALDAEDINLVTGRVDVDDAIVESRRGPHHDTPKTRKGKRRTYLPMIIVERLREILPSSGPVARNLDGSRMAPNWARKIYTRELEKLPDGVPRVIMKDLRHSSLTLAYDSGSDEKDLPSRAGHGSFAVTDKHYIRSKGGKDKIIARHMDAALRANMCQSKQTKLVSGEVVSF